MINTTQKIELSNIAVTLDGLPAQIGGVGHQIGYVETLDQSRVASFSWQTIKRIVDDTDASEGRPAFKSL